MSLVWGNGSKVLTWAVSGGLRRPYAGGMGLKRVEMGVNVLGLVWDVLGWRLGAGPAGRNRILYVTKIRPRAGPEPVAPSPQPPPQGASHQYVTGIRPGAGPEPVAPSPQAQPPTATPGHPTPIPRYFHPFRPASAPSRPCRVRDKNSAEGRPRTGGSQPAGPAPNRHPRTPHTNPKTFPPISTRPSPIPPT